MRRDITACTGWLFFLAVLLLIPALQPGAVAKQRTLALFNLKPTNIDAMGYEGEILYALITELDAEESVSLISRREMEEILFDAGMVQSDDPDTIVKAGKLLGSEFILFGQVTKRGAVIAAKLKLMDVAAKRVIKTWTRNFSGRDAILSKIPAFSEELVRVIQNAETTSSIARQENSGASVSYDISEFKAKSAGKKVVLTWRFDPEDPIVEFNVYRSDSMDGPFQFHGKTDKNLFEDRKIKKGRTYYYKLGLVLTNGSEVKDKGLASVKNAGEKIPHAPLGSDSSGFVRRARIIFLPSFLNKKEKFKIEKYNIYRKGPGDDDWKTIDTITSRKSAQDTSLAFTYIDTKGLEDGKAYSYAVAAIDSKDRESPLSDVIEIRTVARPSLRVEKENLLRKALLAWDPVKGAEGFNLYRRDKDGEWDKNARLRGPEKLSYMDDKRLEDGAAYTYHLRAYDSEGETGPSNEVTASTKEPPPPPADLAAQSDMLKSVKLTWTPVDDPDVGGYSIYRGKNTEKLEKIAKVKGYQTDSYVDNGGIGFNAGLEDGTKYFYTVISYNLYGAEGKPPFSVSAVTKPRPVPVREIEAEYKDRSIVVTWSKNPENDIKHYIVYKSRNGGYWSKVAEAPAEHNRIMDDDIKPESEYIYKIIAVDLTNLKSDPVESGAVVTPYWE